LLWQKEMASYARRNQIDVDALTVDQRQGLAWDFRRQTRQRLDPFQQAVDTLIADLPPGSVPTESITALLDPPATDASDPQDVISAQRAAARVGAEVIRCRSPARWARPPSSRRPPSR
jgi:hypothetical protein